MHIYAITHVYIYIYIYIYMHIIYIYIYVNTYVYIHTLHGMDMGWFEYFLHSQLWKNMENLSLCPLKFSPEASKVPTMRNMPYVMAVPWLHRRGTPWEPGTLEMVEVPGGTHHGDLQ